MDQRIRHSFKSQLRALTALGVFSVGSEKCEPAYTWGPGVRDHYLIHYIATGAGTLRVDGRNFSAEAGQAFLIYPKQLVAYTADAQNPWEYVWVGFAGTDAAGLIAQTGFTHAAPVQRIQNGEQLHAQIVDIYASRGSDTAHTLRMTGGLYNVLSVLVSGTPRGQSAQEEYVSAALRYIAQRYSYPITISNIAHFVGVDRSHLYEVFTHMMGISPKAYLTQFRVDVAKTLLRTTQLHVAEVASSVGYENSLYFSKVFRGAQGCTPTAFRALCQRDGVL